MALETCDNIEQPPPHSAHGAPCGTSTATVHVLESGGCHVLAHQHSTLNQQSTEAGDGGREAEQLPDPSTQHKVTGEATTPATACSVRDPAGFGTTFVGEGGSVSVPATLIVVPESSSSSQRSGLAKSPDFAQGVASASGPGPLLHNTRASAVCHLLDWYVPFSLPIFFLDKIYSYPSRPSETHIHTTYANSQ